MKFNIKKLIPHILVLLGFVIASLAYFSPVLDGKKIFQIDIAQHMGLSKEATDFRVETGEETYWTNSAFGGLPTYQLGAQYPHSYNKVLDRTIRFLPRPADYLFLYFLGLYVLLLVMRVNWKLAALGALAFGFSTYLIIILGIGHNSKAHAIAYMPLVLSGILLSFRGRFIWGFILLAVSMSLEIMANHFQMTYYLLLLVVVLGIVYLIDAFKKKMLPHYFKAIGVMFGAVLLAIATNATNLMATQEYTKFSTRGDATVTINPDGTEKERSSGLDYDYITEYSYGIVESFNVFMARFMGGSSGEPFPENSNAADHLLGLGATPQQANQFLQQIPLYWGNQPYVGAPAYVGATVIFLFILALFLVKGRAKYWLLAGTIMSLMLSWGHNFNLLTEFFIDYVPLYNKFRAITSIQVILELCIPILAVLGLVQLFNPVVRNEDKLKGLKIGTAIVSGLCLIFILFKTSLFDFVNEYDSLFIEEMGIDFIKAVRADRASLLANDAIRSMIFILLIAGFILAYLYKKVSENMTIVGLAILILIDLVAVDKRYVNNDDFVAARQVEIPFQPNAADDLILKDDGYFRVLDITSSPLANAKASYFHNSMGGYFAAKPRRMQDLYDFHLYDLEQNVLNMMNVKYIIRNNEGNIYPQRNPFPNGAAWFIDSLKVVEDDNSAILALKDLDTKNNAIIQSEFASQVSSSVFEKDSLATIRLTSYKPNELVYESNTSINQFAVFSEIYYENGWNAYIDGVKTKHVRVNYTLRGLEIPKGKHEIVFLFEPEVVQKGSKIVLGSSIVLILLVFGGLFYEFRKRKTA